VARLPKTALAIDHTGVGRPVTDLLRALLPNTVLVLGITVTAGSTVASSDPACYNVPKRSLVSNAQVLFQSGKLKIAKESPLAGTLVKELEAYRVKVTSPGHESFEGDWREGQQDDLVFAVMLACWLGTNLTELHRGPVVYNSHTTPSPPEPPSNWREALEDLNIDIEDDREGRSDPWPR
jgi:hypothetical protein